MGLPCTKRRSRLLLGVIFSCSMFLIPQTLLAVSAAFTYDAAGRLLTAQYGDGQHVAYAYDSVGNVTQQVARGFGGGELGAAVIQLLLGNAKGANPYSSVLIR